MMYLEEIDSSTSEELKKNPTVRALKALDVKVYTSAIACIKGREHNEHMLKLRSELQRGNGRLALKLLDEAHKHETDEISDRAAESPV